ncbi:IS30 family transposase [Amycolatopsis alba]|uniref:IS30 family transposase n=1 Tax=Amycolatopsis alba TaxID=76020 RepID=UPI001FD840D7|nr:IS30 family transposase [Amycolatopsis alba]
MGRNGGRETYSPLVAQRRTDRLRKRPKARKVLKSPFLTRAVVEGLRKKWSPMQIAHRLRLEHPMDHSRWMSHEAIYQALFVQAKGTLRAEVAEGLRQGRIKRRARSRGAELRGKIKDMVLISDRPAEAEDRAVPGFREGDLIVGAKNQSQIATLVERSTRFVMLVRIPHDRTADNVAPRPAAKMNTLPDVFKNSVTWDQGGEMGHHKQFTMTTGMPVYFCNPRSPWQHGSNENTMGCCANISPREPTCPCTRRTNSMPSHTNSTTGHDRRWDDLNPSKRSAKCCQTRGGALTS